MTGAFLRVKRNEKFENVEIEHLTDGEREEILGNDERLMQWLHCVCGKLAELQPVFDGLVEDGILARN